MPTQTTASAGTFLMRIVSRIASASYLRVVAVAAETHGDGAGQRFTRNVGHQFERLFDARGELKKSFGVVAQIFEHLLFLRIHLTERL